MSRALRCACIAGAAWAVGAARAEPGRVYLRGVAEPMAGELHAVDRAGVALSVALPTGGSTVRVVPWDRVRGIEDSSGRPVALAPSLAALADGVFRVRARLERGDVDLAAPLAERLAAQPEEIGGPTEAVVAECLLRVRLARGAHAAAVGPWLRLVAARAARPAVVPGEAPAWVEAAWGGTPGPAPVIDDATGLCVQVPPVFSGARGQAALRAFLDEPAAGPAAGSARARALRAWYRSAAAHAVGVVAPVPASASVHTGDEVERLVADVVLASAGQAEDREAARGALLARLRGWDGVPDGGDGAPIGTLDGRRLPGLIAWCHAGVGLSMLREESAGARAEAVLHLIQVPARFAEAVPVLAGVCLAEAASALRAQGQPEAAGALEDELRALDGALIEAGNPRTDDASEKTKP